ncbi:uncharacterized protein I206_106709 [Kwoniella pini CBS 10737]|uniref:RING-type domain-containing protein n=1 Tax=Kwoniella pini CBS 10737 TaxID=1296096 RepID=A0A1B9HTG1_9TREE|nr:uncharacterized protein I206_07402 [Kwoniella pini CBS 10737]OCF46549.1 hypothetical protein I206_07402 [Kwoniella pini CBS 10737]
MPSISTPSRKKSTSQPYNKDTKGNDSHSSRTSSSNIKSESSISGSSLLQIIQDADNRLKNQQNSSQTGETRTKKKKERKRKRGQQLADEGLVVQSQVSQDGDQGMFNIPTALPYKFPSSQVDSRQANEETDENMIPTRSVSPSKGTPITNKEKEKLKVKRERKERNKFVNNQLAKIEMEKEDTEDSLANIVKEKELEIQRRKKEIDAKDKLNLIEKQTEDLKAQADAIRKEIAQLENHKKELQIRDNEEKKRRSDQDLAKFREEKRKQKEMEDKIQETEKAAKEWKEKFNIQQLEEKRRNEENEKVINGFKKSIEKITEDSKSNQIIIHEHENTRKAIIEALECKICLNTVDDAYITSCGHMACKQCMVTYFRSTHAFLHEIQEPITDDTDLSYRTKVCYVCRSAILRKPARVFPLRDILGPLGEYKHKDPPKETDPDPWEKIFPADHEGYKLYDKADDIIRCPECLGELIDNVCSGCDIVFSDAGEDEEGIEESEEEVVGSVLGDEDVVRVDGTEGFIDDEADASGTDTSSSGDEDTPGRIRRSGAVPPPPPSALNNLLTILTEGEGDYVGTEMSSEDEREENSEDEYGGSFIDDDDDGEEEEEDNDVKMVDTEDDEVKSDSEEELPRIRHSSRSQNRSRSSRRVIDPDEDEDEEEPISSGRNKRKTTSRQATVILSEED